MAKKKDDIQDEAQIDLATKIDELTADLQRAHADFANFRRRSDEERIQLADFAKIAVFTQLLPLIDNVERALNHMPPELAENQWAKGVAQLAKQFETSMKELGVERIATVGEPFNPHLHEAVSYDEEGEGEEVITDELQAGYKLGDQVIRHSMVKVGRSAAPEAQEEEE